MIQLQFLNKLLNTKDYSLINLNNLDVSYFSEYKDEFRFIKEHYDAYRSVPDKETFVDKFPDFPFVNVHETDDFLLESLQEEKLYLDSYDLLSTVSKEMTDGDSRKAVQMLISGLPKLTTQLNVSAVDLLHDADIRFNEYCEKGNTPEKYFVSTGLTELDKILGGWDRKNDMVGIGGRPGIGKSWWLDYFLLKAAEKGEIVGLFSGEMDPSQVGYRLDTFMSHISNFKISKGYNDVFQDYKEHIDKLKEMKGKFIVCTPNTLGGKPTVSKLKSFCEKYNITLLGIDQYSLLQTDGYSKNRVDKYEQISMDIKNMQTALGIPVLVACQLNRGASNPDISDPGTENFAGSDRISQDCSVLLTLQNKDKVVRIRVAKGRSGGTGEELCYVWDIDKGNLTLANTTNEQLSNADTIKTGADVDF